MIINVNEELRNYERQYPGLQQTIEDLKSIGMPIEAIAKNLNAPKDVIHNINFYTTMMEDWDSYDDTDEKEMF